jgi:Rad3-related DNA helicase
MNVARPDDPEKARASSSGHGARRSPFTLRTGQAEAIRDVLTAFEKGARTVFLDAPVGSGKSLINLLVARELGGAYLSTPQVLLVDQYGRDTAAGAKFAGLATTLYGRRNYPCEYVRALPEELGGNLDATAENAPCTILEGWPRECPAFDRCSYYGAKAEAQAHPQTVTTLAYLLRGIRNGLADEDSGWELRPLLVIDEAHGLADDLVQFYMVEIGPTTLHGFTFATIAGSADPRALLLGTLPGYIKRQSRALRPLQTRSRRDRDTEEKIERLVTSVNRASRILSLLRRTDVTWVHAFEASRRRHSWKPLSAALFVRPFWERFERVLLSSATFFDMPGLVRDAGLPEPWAKITVADTFPPDRAPVVLLSAARMGRNAAPQDMEKALAAVARVAAAHPSERGLIHANSYRLADALREGLPPETRRRLVFHDRLDRMDRFEAWKVNAKTDSVFVAVSMHEGLDLVGDLARWQIILKVPFPDLGDPWIERRRAEPDGSEWYEARAVLDVLQAAGRIMRSADDRGATYIVDSHFDWLLRKNWRSVPEWFRKRIEAGRSALPAA